MFRRVLLGVAMICGLGDGAARGSAADDMRPNVVMIISDDQGFGDFGFMGNDVVETPNLDALASRSARFTRGYVPASVCRPSLVTLLTGLYPHHHGVHFNHPPPGFSKLTRTMNRQQFDTARERATRLIRNADTLPRLLSGSGYRCLQTGKYWEGHYRNAGFTDGMTTATPSPGARYGNKELANGDLVAHGNGDAGLAIGRETMQPIDDFLSDVGTSPFLIWYAPFLPHLPHDSPDRFKNGYDESLPSHLRDYYSACTQFDETVGRLMERLQRRPSDRPTLFVFVVDNGFRPDPEQPMRDGFGYNYTHRSKRSPFEDGLRTPILLAMDEVIEPGTHTSLVSSVDIVPTILEACSVRCPTPLDGKSLWSVAIGQSRVDPHRAVFGAIYPGDASVLGNPAADVAYRWVRQGDDKLIVPHVRGGKAWGDYGDDIQLYDLKKDPLERRNLAQDPAQRERVMQLKEQLDGWWLPSAEQEQ